MKENWKEVRLGDCVEFRKGKGLKKDDLLDKGNYPCIHYGELFTKYNGVIDKTISYTDNPPSNPVVSEGEEVLLPTSGETPDGIVSPNYLKTVKSFWVVTYLY